MAFDRWKLEEESGLQLNREVKTLLTHSGVARRGGAAGTPPPRLPATISGVILERGGGIDGITTMIEDTELLRRYAEENSEDAFAELVQRRIGMVYAVALRRTGGDAPAAEDATQEVFVDLARKAASLSRRPVLAGWLYRSAQFAAADITRAERRRQAREQEAHRMQDIEQHASEPDWNEFRPLIDELLNEMEESDRDAVLLRFFDGRPFAEIGARFRLTENAARMRVERAIEKLRDALAKRGVTSTAGALGVALAHQVAAPAGLAVTVTGASLAGAAGAAAGGVAVFLGLTKLQIGIAGAMAVAGVAGFVAHERTNDELRRELAAWHEQRPAVAAMRLENRQLAATAAEVEMLRRDDVELKQLAQNVAEVQRVSQEKARLAQAQAAVNRRAQLEAGIREKDRLAQLEVERLNREGNALVGEYKALTAQAKDPSLTSEGRAQAGAAAKAKLAAIQAKQREKQDFITETRRKLMEEAAALRTIAPDAMPGFNPTGFLQGAGRLELRRSPAAEGQPAGVPVFGEITPQPPR